MVSPDFAVVLEFLQALVFWSSIATLFLAAIESSVRKFFPGSGAEKAVAFVTDLVSQFGALNLRDKIAPRKWDGQDRRGEKGN